MAVTTEEVKKLAELARLALSDAEIEKLKGEIDSIIAYVDVIQKVKLPEKPEPSVYLDIENVTREDASPHEPGIHTDALLAQAPEREGNFLKVKKILS